MNRQASAAKRLSGGAAFLGLALVAASLDASSHREAPFITQNPKVDATDFYMFRSYEPGRQDFVTVVANYLPLQDPYGGPNYFSLDPNALYEIHFDNDGDAVEDITFQFRFRNNLKDIALPIGPPGNEKLISVPLINVGGIPADGADDPANPANLNVVESYSVTMVRGDRRRGSKAPITDAFTGASTFTKPVDNIGNKSLADYESYVSNFIYDIDLPGSDLPGRLFVGQRKDSFVVNLGETFDLVNTNPLGAEDGEKDDLADKNITSFILELPISFLTAGDQPVIGGWTSASLRQARVLNPRPRFGRKGAEVVGGAFTQVSRLSSPLVNEVVIGLKDKDRFNASEPKDDGQFLDYVTNPTLPALLEILFGVRQPNLFPRDDLVAAFLTGVDGLNDNGGVGEMLRLNTAIDPTPKCEQSRLGVIDGDIAGFPNGRRPGDDVVDIELRVVMGVLLDPSIAPDGQLPFTDGAIVDATFFEESFPYLTTPIPGSPSDAVVKRPKPCPLGLDPCPDCSRVVYRNAGPDPIAIRLASTNQSINNGQPITLDVGGEFSESFGGPLLGLNVFVFVPGLGELDQGFQFTVPIGRQQIFERDGTFLGFCLVGLDEECPSSPGGN